MTTNPIKKNGLYKEFLETHRGGKNYYYCYTPNSELKVTKYGNNFLKIS